MGHPTIYPTGVTVFNPEKAWNGYTILPAPDKGALLIGMNGHEIRLWENVQGFPNKMFPGGMLMGSRGTRHPKYGLQDQLDLIQVDWSGNVVWEFNKAEFIEDPGRNLSGWPASITISSARAVPPDITPPVWNRK